MDHGDYYWGLYRAYYKDPFPHSLLSTRQMACVTVGFRIKDFKESKNES